MMSLDITLNEYKRWPFSKWFIEVSLLNYMALWIVPAEQIQNVGLTAVNIGEWYN